MTEKTSLITLGDKEWSLEGQTVTINDLIALDELGVDFKDLEKNDASDPVKSMRLVRSIAYILLRKINPELTVEKVGDMIPIEKAGEVSTFFMDFFNARLPEAQKDSVS